MERAIQYLPWSLSCLFKAGSIKSLLMVSQKVSLARLVWPALVREKPALKPASARRLVGSCERSRR